MPNNIFHDRRLLCFHIETKVIEIVKKCCESLYKYKNNTIRLQNIHDSHESPVHSISTMTLNSGLHIKTLQNVQDGLETWPDGSDSTTEPPCIIRPAEIRARRENHHPFSEKKNNIRIRTPRSYKSMASLALASTNIKPNLITRLMICLSWPETTYNSLNTQTTRDTEINKQTVRQNAARIYIYIYMSKRQTAINTHREFAKGFGICAFRVWWRLCLYCSDAVRGVNGGNLESAFVQIASLRVSGVDEMALGELMAYWFSEDKHTFWERIARELLMYFELFSCRLNDNILFLYFPLPLTFTPSHFIF